MIDRSAADETRAGPPGPPDPPDHHSDPPGVFGEAGSLARALIAYAPRRIVLALLLLLVAGVTEMFGLMMIVPLLHVVGLAAQPGERSPITEAVTRAADAVGLELTLPAVLAMFVALAAVRSVVAWQRELLLNGLRLGFVDRFRESFYAAIAGARWEFLLGCRQSDVQHVLTSNVSRIGQSAFLMLNLTVRAVLALAQLALAALISPLMTAAALSTGVVLLVLTRPLIGRSRILGAELTGSNRALYGSVTNFLTGLRLAKSHNAEGPHVRHFSETVATMRQRRLAFVWMSAAARAAVNTGAAAALAGLVWLAVTTAALTLPELLILALIFARVMPAFSHLQQGGQQLAHVLPAYAHARAMYRALREAAEAPAGGEARMALRRGLTVRNASFAYGAKSGAETVEPALDNVDLDVPAGKITAITGPSGAGKSTLTDVLLGLIEPAGGEARVDGVPLTGSNARRWRDSVACVPQDPYLFHGTIRENLRWARPEATEAEMWRALRLAAAADFVASLPAGLDTVTGDRGDWISGGERQRIALGRALVREPALLVLDEVTSQLDAENEQRILAALKSLRGRTTVVAIAHRPALLEEADRIVVLKSGRVAATGTWRELAAEITRSENGADGKDQEARHTAA